MTGMDRHDRRLTTQEAVERDRLLPALQAWTAYLDAVGAHPSFEAGDAARAPIVTRHVASPGRLYSPVVVCPVYALDWAIAAGKAGATGTGSRLTYGQMVDALEFMRSVEATTFRPLNQTSGVRRREGWFRLSPEHVARLRQLNYTPVLTALQGAPRTPRRPLRHDGVRIRSVGAPDATMSVVRDFLRTTARTALFEVALAQNRPLATRPPGRPADSMSRGLVVRRGHVVAHLDALTLHAQDNADRLGLARIPSRSDMRAGLVAQAGHNPEVVAAAVTFSAVDCGQRRKQRDWWRLTLGAFAVPDTDSSELLAEVEHWRARQVPPREVLAPVRGPEGRDPRDMTPEERDWYNCLLPEDL